MIIAETRSFAENISVEIIVANATSFVMQLDNEIIFVETKSFAENIINEIIAADATSFAMKLTSKITFAETRSFDKISADLFSSWYEVWSGAFDEMRFGLSAEMTVVDATSFDEVIDLGSLGPLDKMILVEAKSFDNFISDPFFFLYEVWTEASEADVTEVTEVTEIDDEIISDSFSVLCKIWFDLFDWSVDSVSGNRWSKIHSRIRWWIRFNSCTEGCRFDENSIRFRSHAVWIFQRSIWRAYAVSLRSQNEKSDFATNAADVTDATKTTEATEIANYLINWFRNQCCCTKATGATGATDATDCFFQLSNIEDCFFQWLNSEECQYSCTKTTEAFDDFSSS